MISRRQVRKLAVLDVGDGEATLSWDGGIPFLVIPGDAVEVSVTVEVEVVPSYLRPFVRTEARLEVE